MKKFIFELINKCTNTLVGVSGLILLLPVQRYTASRHLRIIDKSIKIAYAGQGINNLKDDGIFVFIFTMTLTLISSVSWAYPLKSVRSLSKVLTNAFYWLRSNNTNTRSRNDLFLRLDRNDRISARRLKNNKQSLSNLRGFGGDLFVSSSQKFHFLWLMSRTNSSI